MGRDLCPVPECVCHEAVRDLEHLRNVVDKLAARLGLEVCHACDGWGRTVGSYGYIETCRKCDDGVNKVTA